jgi:hypothetical protein
MNISKNILLNNGFKFREFDDNSKNNHSGDFEVFKFEEYRVYFMLSEPENVWCLDISNYKNHKHFEIRYQTEISVEEVNLALRICNIDIVINAEDDSTIDNFCEENKKALRKLYLNAGGSITAIKQIIGEDKYQLFQNMMFVIEHNGSYRLSTIAQSYCNNFLKL